MSQLLPLARRFLLAAAAALSASPLAPPVRSAAAQVGEAPRFQLEEGGAWLDRPGLARWNSPGAPVPVAPLPQAREPAVDPRCASERPPPRSPAEHAVVNAGWMLVAPASRYGWTEVVLGASGHDGMCRPLGYQLFAFQGDRFAGTFSPRLMDSRADGAADLPEPSAGAGDTIVVRFSRYRAADPLCCPSRLTAATYRVETTPRGPLLVLTAVRSEPTERTGAADEAKEKPAAACGGGASPSQAGWACEAGPVGITWQLVRLRAGGAEPFEPTDPARYALELRGGGEASLRLDCNRGGTTYEMRGSSIAFKAPFATTRAACPPGSQADRFAAELGRVAGWEIRGERLLLTGPGGDPTLSFRQAPPP